MYEHQKQRQQQQQQNTQNVFNSMCKVEIFALAVFLVLSRTLALTLLLRLLALALTRSHIVRGVLYMAAMIFIASKFKSSLSISSGNTNKRHQSNQPKKMYSHTKSTTPAMMLMMTTTTTATVASSSSSSSAVASAEREKNDIILVCEENTSND